MATAWQRVVVPLLSLLSSVEGLATSDEPSYLVFQCRYVMKSGQVGTTDQAGEHKSENVMVRVAVVGAGVFGREHARVYSELSGSQLVAVCDIDESRGRPVAEQYGAAFVSDYRELAGMVDAVSVAAPTEAHRVIVCDLLQAKTAVLVEKPIARTLDEADQMIEAARGSGAVLQVGHLERFNPAVTAAA